MRAHPFLSDQFLAEERIRMAEQWLPSAKTFVFELDGRVVGFLSLVGNEVGGLFVHPDAQGHGVGRALMDRARSLEPCLELEVFERNEQGRRFYDAYGFEFVRSFFDDETGQVQYRLRLA